MRAVRFDRYGDIEVLHVADVPDPEPAQREVPVECSALSLTSSLAA
jgi:NADPH2:quinone reductase